MDSRVISLNGINQLRMFSKKNEKDVLYNSEGIRNYRILQYGGISPNQTISWEILEDSNIKGIWFSVDPTLELVASELPVFVQLKSEKNILLFSLFLREAWGGFVHFGGTCLIQPFSDIIPARAGYTLLFKPSFTVLSTFVVLEYCQLSEPQIGYVGEQI